MNEYNTIFYETADGKIPAKEFLLSLNYDIQEIELAKTYRADYYARKENKWQP